jgi:hypothetical protein
LFGLEMAETANPDAPIAVARPVPSKTANGSKTSAGAKKAAAKNGGLRVVARTKSGPKQATAAAVGKRRAQRRPQHSM